MKNLIIVGILAIAAIFIGSWLGTRDLYTSSNKLKNTINESFKKVGIKALSLFAFINIFNSSSELPDNQDSTDEQTSD